MVKIIADTTSSIPVPVAERLGIPYLPQIIIFGDESYRDDCEINSQMFLQKLRTFPSLPKTAAPPPALYEPIFRQLEAEGQTMIVLAPSSDLSGTYRSATVAAQDFPNADIRVIDTRMVAGGLGSLVLLADRWAKEGRSADEIEAGIRNLMPREHLYFMVDTLEYLYKGGRIGGAQALFGSILQVKPILTVKEGRIESFESQRTQKRALARLRELTVTECPPEESSYLTIAHGDAEKLARELAEEFSNTLGIANVPVYELPPAILTHAGPGPIVVSFFVK